MCYCIANRMGYEYVERLGKWRIKQDDMQMSYAQIDNTSTLAKQAGFESLKEYRPTWATLQPPPELMALVLPAFQLEMRKAKEVCA